MKKQKRGVRLVSKDSSSILDEVNRLVDAEAEVGIEFPTTVEGVKALGKFSREHLYCDHSESGHPDDGADNKR